MSIIIVRKYLNHLVPFVKLFVEHWQKGLGFMDQLGQTVAIVIIITVHLEYLFHLGPFIEQIEECQRMDQELLVVLLASGHQNHLSPFIEHLEECQRMDLEHRLIVSHRFIIILRTIIIIGHQIKQFLIHLNPFVVRFKEYWQMDLVHHLIHQTRQNHLRLPFLHRQHLVHCFGLVDQSMLTSLVLELPYV